MANERREIQRHSFDYGHRTISFELSFSPRKRLAINVHPDKAVSVDAPDDKSLDEVLKRVRRRADWILRQIDYFDQFSPLPPERRYISGETHLYLGRQYRLKVFEGNPEQVKLKGRYFWIHTKDKNDSERVRKLMLDWYRSHAKKILLKRLQGCYSVARRVGVQYPTVQFRRMKKRWGSCSSSGTVLLNTELAKAPVHCIDYVIMHELCHLKVPQHGPEFYKLISKLMPDWEKRKERLENIVI